VQSSSAKIKVVSINKGTAKDISRLKGLGLQRAKAIVAYRHTHGEFAHLDDLIKVKGIGRGLLKRVKKNNIGIYRLN
jgi:competence protein ComEA